MLRFVFHRIILLVPTFLGVTILVFALLHMIPGDPVAIKAGVRGISPEQHAQMLHTLGLDKPLVTQYVIYLKQLAHGDFGTSFVTKAPVLQEFFNRFPATVELGLTAMLLAIGIGIPLGILAALWRGKWLDQLIMGVALTGYSMPIFWWGLLLILFFSVHLGWTPVSGRLSVFYYIEPRTHFMLIDTLLAGDKDAFFSALRHLILPCTALATIPMAVIARMMRSSLLEVLTEDYIRTARAKGLSPIRIIGLHALRNALVPVLTTIGLQVGLILSGAILTETIFSWPGIGKWLVSAIESRDYPVVQGGVLLIASLIILINMTIDVLYGLLNPRIRHRQ